MELEWEAAIRRGDAQGIRERLIIGADANARRLYSNPSPPSGEFLETSSWKSRSGGGPWLATAITQAMPKAVTLPKTDDQAQHAEGLGDDLHPRPESRWKGRALATGRPLKPRLSISGRPPLAGDPGQVEPAKRVYREWPPAGLPILRTIGPQAITASCDPVMYQDTWNQINLVMRLHQLPTGGYTLFQPSRCQARLTTKTRVAGDTRH